MTPLSISPQSWETWFLPRLWMGGALGKAIVSCDHHVTMEACHVILG